MILVASLSNRAYTSELCQVSQDDQCNWHYYDDSYYGDNLTFRELEMVIVKSKVDECGLEETLQPGRTCRRTANNSGNNGASK